MSSSSSRSLFLSTLAVGAALFAACDSTQATDTDDDPVNPPISSDGGGSSGPKRDAGPSTPPRDASSDAAKKDGATTSPRDAEPDVQIPPGDGGPTLLEPEPGTPCTVVGETFTRGCGSCGSQNAFCSPSHQVTGYGACRSAEGACTPGSTEPGAACGACGTTTRTCNAQCVFDDGVCEGELAGGCVAGRTEQRAGDCATGQTILYECNASCAWQVQQGAACTGIAAFPVITIAPTEGTTVNRPVTAAEQALGQRNLFNGCSALSVQIVHGRFFELQNPTAQPAIVDVWNTAQSAQWDFVLIAYDEPPLAPGDLIGACTAVNDACNVAPYSASSDVCFASSTALTIPANGRRWVYIGNFSSAAPAYEHTLHVKTVDLL